MVRMCRNMFWTAIPTAGNSVNRPIPITNIICSDLHNRVLQNMGLNLVINLDANTVGLLKLHCKSRTIRTIRVGFWNCALWVACRWCTNLTAIAGGTASCKAGDICAGWSQNHSGVIIHYTCRICTEISFIL